jgi:hypothetical protein
MGSRKVDINATGEPALTHATAAPAYEASSISVQVVLAELGSVMMTLAEHHAVAHPVKRDPGAGVHEIRVSSPLAAAE